MLGAGAELRDDRHVDLLEQLRVTLRTCVACGEPTNWVCADCEIDNGVVTPVCASPACRDAHEARSCSATTRLEADA